MADTLNKNEAEVHDESLIGNKSLEAASAFSSEGTTIGRFRE